ncbi:MAG: hypothetical protein OEX02_12055 [Cyclobacteriaceae bacterium]|nr:hypothetical protein [Cyclobacteriaceae bacterium]
MEALHRVLFVVLGGLLLLNVVQAQEITNLSFEIKGRSVEISYDLSANTNQYFIVELYSDQDGYAKKLSHVRGDIGEDVTPGERKRIIWDAGNELGDFKGAIELEVRGRIMPPILEFSATMAGKYIRRGKLNDIVWTTHTSEPSIRLELYREGKKITDLGLLDNTGKYTWAVPVSQKTGSRYQLVAVSLQSEKRAVSPVFKIGQKVPVGLKVAPAALLLPLGYIIYDKLTNGGGTNGGTENQKIVDPWEPGG